MNINKLRNLIIFFTNYFIKKYGLHHSTSVIFKKYAIYENKKINITWESCMVVIQIDKDKYVLSWYAKDSRTKNRNFYRIKEDFIKVISLKLQYDRVKHAFTKKIEDDLYLIKENMVLDLI
jgi:hypothetical protein